MDVQKFKTFGKIVLPMSKPNHHILCGITIHDAWMDYILPNILLSGNDSKNIGCWVI